MFVSHFTITSCRTVRQVAAGRNKSTPLMMTPASCKIIIRAVLAAGGREILSHGLMCDYYKTIVMLIG